MTLKDRLFEKFVNGKVTKIYSGKDDACRCGCQGKYYTQEEPSKFLSTFSKVMDRLSQPCLTEEHWDLGFVNISLGNNRAYTIYFDK